MYERSEAKGSIPSNLIPAGCTTITPSMLPLIDLDPVHIELIVRSIPGGAPNIQDIYPLTPLQEGIFFHHLLAGGQGDSYVTPTLLELSSRAGLEAFIGALQRVIDRHDSLRTAVLWEGLPRPVQVVCHNAPLPVEEILVDPDRDPLEQLHGLMSFDRQRMDLRRAPLIRLHVTEVRTGLCYVVLQQHHLASDNESMEVMISEAAACVEGRGLRLPEPIQYRNVVARTLELARTLDTEAFFRKKLGDIDEPTAPFGLVDVRGEGSRSESVTQPVEAALALQVRALARSLRVSVATLFHAVWALVVAQTSGRADLVYGTVLLGRLQLGRGKRGVGLAINTLPIRINLEGLSAHDLVRQTQHELFELLAYEQASLATAQRGSAVPAGEPLFTTLLNYRQSASTEGWGRISGVRQLASQQWTQYPITLAIDDYGDQFTLTAKSDRSVDPCRIVALTQAALASLVHALESAPQPALSLSVLPESERLRVTELFNSTQTVFPGHLLIHELFAEQAAHKPSALAVSCDGHTLTYAELDARANHLARHLRNCGIGPDRLVAVYLEPGVDLVIALVGVLKAGGAYVPLDPRAPLERLRHILDDARPLTLLTVRELQDTLPETSVEVILLNEYWVHGAPEENTTLTARSIGLTSRHLAYVIYTSGSTGRPKGVMIEHRSLVNYSLHAAQEFNVAEGEGSLIATSVSFDLMLTGLYPTLISGKLVRFCTDQSDLAALSREVLKSRNLAPLKLTPSHLAVLEQTLPDEQLEGRIKVLVLGGEPLMANALERWYRYAPGTTIFNHYGPTETTIGCVIHALAGERSGAVPIGRPISNVQIYILDRRRKPVPIGVAGEIYIGGEGVARGYLNRPDLTADRFLSNPFGADPDARFYKSGDLGRWRPDGTIEYLGRNDDQVKIRGYRIEPGEVAAQLKRHTQVKDAAVVAREDILGEKRLVAYVVPSQRPSTALSVDNLRAHLRLVLPEYMIPSAYVFLEYLPLTPNGKLNRPALPEPERDAYGACHSERPSGEIEETLAEIWSEVLSVEGIGRDDNFFELGGHSLLGLRVITRVAESLGTPPPVATIFQYPTIREMAKLVATLLSSAPTPPVSTPAERECDLI